MSKIKKSKAPWRVLLDTRLLSIIIHLFSPSSSFILIFFSNFYLFIFILNFPLDLAAPQIQRDSLGRQRAKCALPVRPNSGLWFAHSTRCVLLSPPPAAQNLVFWEIAAVLNARGPAAAPGQGNLRRRGATTGL